MASIIPGMGGTSMEVNRSYSYAEHTNVRQVRTTLDNSQLLELEQSANVHNSRLQAELGTRRKINTGGKPDFDAFLKLLTEQLKHQDPLKPLEDKDFIAQMAQFSSLGEMKKFNKYMKGLVNKSDVEMQYNLLGRRVYYTHKVGNNNEVRSGIVSAISTQNQGEVMIGNNSIRIKNIMRVEVAESQTRTNNVLPANNSVPIRRNDDNRNRERVIPASTAGSSADIHNLINAEVNNANASAN
jgi:flagellar basal-body rod modification protein FlgD